MATTTAARVSVGGGKLSVADVCAVAALGAKVAVDAAEAGVAPATHAAAATLEAAAPAASDAFHPREVARAVLLLQLHELLRLCRRSDAVLALADFLAALLNSDVTLGVPVRGLSSTSVVLAATQGQGVALSPSPAPLAAALQAAGVALPATELSAHDKAALALAPPLPLLAVGALAVGGARSLLPLSDAVAALSCEVARVNTTPFEAEHVDASRPHRGIVTSAANLRLMLDNSKFANAAAETKDVDAFRSIPQYHGPVRDAVLAAYKTVEAELNHGASLSTAIHPQALATALATVVDGLKVLQQGSSARLAALSSSAGKSEAASSSQDAVALVQEVSKALAQELAPSLQFFDEQDAELQARMAEKQAKAQEAAAKAAAAAAKEDEKLAAMPEAQRAKILEKRRKKLEKQKEKEVIKKKPAADEVKIGLGSQVFRQFVVAAPSIEAALTPFNLRADGAAAVVEDVIARLGSGGARRKPKIAKGAQDFLPAQMQLREKIFNKIRMVFKRHAGVEIETPVFELKETLTGKYGEDSKLIYDLADQGGELLALRYDLTVPFARFMALHNPGNIKRYHIARVYRRDNPQMARGRFREFYQCDFDVAGSYAPMLPDAEVLSIGVEVLQQFPEVGPFKVKLSHRRLLDAVLSICGVPADKFRTTCSAIDKLDKEPWEAVRREMVEEKGVEPEVADRIQQFVCKVGSPRALHAELVREKLFGDNADAKAAMDDLALLFDYLDAMGVLDYMSFDLSLARGLDYYTGLIYEFVLTSPEHNVGSIAAGGRYDNLVGMFSATGQQIPCVGVSMGIERIFGILQAHAEKTKAMATPASQVLVASTGAAPELLLARLQLCQELWRANVAAEVMQSERPKFTKQLHYALEAGIPYMVVVGEDELAQGQVKIKDMVSKEEVSVARTDMVAELLRRGCRFTSELSI